MRVLQDNYSIFSKFRVLAESGGSVHDFASIEDISTVRSPATATFESTCRSEWNGLTERVPLPMCNRPCREG